MIDTDAMEQVEKILKNAKIYLIFVAVALFAIFVLPGFASPHIVPKEIFGVVIAALVLVLGSVLAIIKGGSKLSIGKYDFAVILLTLAYVLAAIFRTPNKLEAFFFPGTVTLVIISAIFYFLINQFGSAVKKSVLTAVFFSGIILSISILFTQLGLFSKIPQLPLFMKDPSFNPTGGFLPALIYLIVALPIGIIQAIKNKDIVKRTFFGVAILIIIFAATVLTINLLPGKPQSAVFPSMQTSWEITIETLKASPIFGAGSGNYLTAFNLYRPVTYNQTALWATRFSSATNFYFTLITELGFVGLAALVILLIAIYKNLVKGFKQKSWEEISIVILVVSFALFPASPVHIFLLMVLLAVFSKSEEKVIDLANTKISSAIVAAPVFIGVIALGIFGTKVVAAELTYKNSLDALSSNDGKTTYDLMTSASTQSQYVDRYHASLAQIDMALATSIANKEELSDTDRETITQLIQQAIDQGKATVTLNPARSGNWEILAQIYRSIMSFATGSDQFAIQSYTQAVALDPINPNLRISLGGVYYALGDFDSAIDSFKMAVLAKSDLANAHYNLAIAYREKKDFESAIAEMKTVMSLVTPDSPDYTLAKSTLEDLEKNKPVTATDGTESLITPQKQTTVIEPPITLPEEGTPPAAP
jgi:tetratricopeptide (TPR) repeat protein